MGSHLAWNVGDIGGTSFLGYLDLIGGDFDKTVDRLKALGAEDEGPGDKTTVEFRGTYNGAVFTLYDYYNDGRLHIGGHDDPVWGGVPLDVEGLKAHLGRLAGLDTVVDIRKVLGR